jgi:hypothetical protein
LGPAEPFENWDLAHPGLPRCPLAKMRCRGTKTPGANAGRPGFVPRLGVRSDNPIRTLWRLNSDGAMLPPVCSRRESKRAQAGAQGRD